MAERPRRIRAWKGPTYLQPKTEKEETQEAYLLHIKLPGFTEERIRVELEDSSTKFRVSGERAVDDGGKRKSRFNYLYSFPENCTTQIHRNFYQGILTITIPKIISQEQVKTAQEKAPSPPKKAENVEELTPPKSATAREEELRDKKSVSSPSTSMKGPEEAKVRRDFDGQKPEKESILQKPETTMADAEKLADESKPKITLAPKDEKGEEETMQKPKITMGQAPEKQIDDKSGKGEEETVMKRKIIDAAPEKQTDDDRPPKPEEETEPKPTLKRKPTDEESGKAEEDRKVQKVQNENEAKPERGQEETKHDTALTTVPQKQEDEKTVGRRDEDAEKERLSKKEIEEAEGKPSELSAPKIPRKEQENTGKTGADSANDGMIDAIGKGMKEATSTVLQAFTRFAGGKWDEEERHSIINISASALVLAALGIYGFYRFSSSERT